MQVAIWYQLIWNPGHMNCDLVCVLYCYSPCFETSQKFLIIHLFCVVQMHLSKCINSIQRSLMVSEVLLHNFLYLLWNLYLDSLSQQYFPDHSKIIFFSHLPCTKPDGYCKLCLVFMTSFCMMVLLHSLMYPGLHYLLQLYFRIVSVILSYKVREFLFLRVSPFGIMHLSFTKISSFYAYYLKLVSSISEVGHTQIIHDSKHILLHLLAFSLHENQ